MIDAHRGAFEYDWRTRFHVSLSSVGKRMTWGEAIRLTKILSGDPSSQVGAAVSELDHPIDRIDMTLRDLYDLWHTVAHRQSGSSKDPTPYPRPYPDPNKQTKQIGDASLPLPELRRVLDAHRAAVEAERFKQPKRDARGRLHDERGRFIPG